MQSLISMSFVPYALCVLAGAVAGAWVSGRLARRSRRDTVRQLAQRELDLLDSKSDVARLTAITDLDARREELLALAMRRLSESQKRASALEINVSALRERHKLDTDRLQASIADLRKSSRDGVAVENEDLTQIEGINHDIERQLNAAGIHRVEQLASLSDIEADALDLQLAAIAERDRANRRVAADDSPDEARSGSLLAGVRKLLRDAPPA